MNNSDIERINELARKSKNEGLSDSEKEEQKRLRQEYIKAVRENLRANLNNITIINEDGSRVNLGEKYGKKRD